MKIDIDDMIDAKRDEQTIDALEEKDAEIKRLRAEIDRKDVHLRSARTYCKEGMPKNALGHIEQALQNKEKSDE